MGGYGDETCHPGGAAHLSSAGTYAANAPSLLSGTNLLHLDADAETVGQHLDEFAEVDTLVGNVVEDGFGSVALVLYVANFHVQHEVLSNLSGLEHGLLLKSFGLFPLLEVGGSGNAIDAFELVGVWVDVVFVHLEVDQTTEESDHADVVARRGLYGHHVARFEGYAGRVAVVGLAGVLELHLDEVGCVGWGGQVGQPVVGVQFATAHGTCATATGGLLGAVADFGNKSFGLSLIGFEIRNLVVGSFYFVFAHRSMGIMGYMKRGRGQTYGGV